MDEIENTYGDLLTNTLNANEELKKVNEKLRKQLDILSSEEVKTLATKEGIMLRDWFKTILGSLKKENEELKENNNTLSEKLDVSEEPALKIIINLLNKENQELKTKIKELDKTIYSFIKSASNEIT